MSDDTQLWSEQLSTIQEDLGSLYERLHSLRDELKQAGGKADAHALGEPLERMARYGRLFSDILASWNDPQD